MRSNPIGQPMPEVVASFDAPLKGILIVSFGIMIFAVQDVIIRHLSSDYSAMQIMFIRGLVAIVFISLFVYWEGGLPSLGIEHPFLNGLRGVLMVTSYTTYYMSLAALPIAEVTAIFFIAPLIVTMFSALFLGEFVGIRRWSAVFVGFIGVMVIVQPGSRSLDIAALLPLVGAVTYAASIIITRYIGHTQTGSSLAFIAMGIFVIVSGTAGFVMGDGSFGTDYHPSLTFLFRSWIVPETRDLLFLTACGLISACGFYCLSQGYRIAPASVVAPFEYIAMPMAVISGFLFWREVPTLFTLAGISLIIGSGLYILRKETTRSEGNVTNPPSETV